MRASDLTPEEKMAVFEFLNRGQAVRAYEVQQHLNVSVFLFFRARVSCARGRRGAVGVAWVRTRSSIGR